MPVLFAAVSLAGTSSLAQQPPDGVPAGMLIVKGAWSSSSDSSTPLPEGGSVTNGVYSNEYFGIRFALSDKWTERYRGPPPSDSGYYVLAQFEPAATQAGSAATHLLIAAQDLFFALTPVRNALEQVTYSRDHLASKYIVETPPTQVPIAGHGFVRLDYRSPVSALHWRILAIELRCHIVQFIFSGRDPKLIDQLSAAMDTMNLPPDNAGPMCLQDYANSDSKIAGENPILNSQGFNPIPVRITIDTAGRVRHIHFLSAFPEQAATIQDVVGRWRFKPRMRDGHPIEVETGIMFGRTPQNTAPTTASVSNSPQRGDSH